MSVHTDTGPGKLLAGFKQSVIAQTILGGLAMPRDALTNTEICGLPQLIFFPVFASQVKQRLIG